MAFIFLESEYTNIWNTFSAWGQNFKQQLPNIITAIVFLIIVFFLSGWVKKFATKILHRKSGNPAIATVMASFISIIFISVGIFIALAILGLNQSVKSLLAGAGIMGLVLGLALQDTLSSAIAGIIMTTRKAYKVGDFVESNDFLGTIVDINLRNTTVRQTTGADVKIPNKLVLSNPLINYSLTGQRRVDIILGVSYNENLQAVELITRNAFLTVDYNHDKPIEIFFTEFAATSIKVVVRFWIKKFKQSDFLEAQSAAVKAIQKSYIEHGITIPYTIQTVEIKNNLNTV